MFIAFGFLFFLFLVLTDGGKLNWGGHEVASQAIVSPPTQPTNVLAGNDTPPPLTSQSQQAAESFLAAWKRGENIDSYLAGQLATRRKNTKSFGTKPPIDVIILSCTLKEYRDLKLSGSVVYQSDNSFAETKADVFTIDAIQSVVGHENLTLHIISEGPEIGKLIHIEGSD